MADLPGGASGLLVRDYSGKEADRLVTRIDPGVVSLVPELRARERPGRRGIGPVEGTRRAAQAPRRKPGGDPPCFFSYAATEEREEKPRVDL